MATDSITQTFDALEAAITAPGFDWRLLAYDLLGKLITGVTVGLGIAVGLALAG